MRAILGPQICGAADHDLGFQVALVGADAGDLAVGPEDVQDLVAGQEGHAALGGPADLGLDGEDGLGEAVGGDVQACRGRGPG